MDDRRVVIEIYSNGQKKEEGLTNSADVSNKSNNPLKSKVNKINAHCSAASAMALKYVGNEVEGFISNSFSWYNNMTDNYLSQNLFNSIKSGFGVVNTLISSTWSGAKIGGVPGAVTGAVVAAAGTVVKARENYMNSMVNLNETNINTDFNAARLGLIDGGRGTLN